MASTRIACLRVPLFPLAARLRIEPGLRGQALVIVDGRGASARVLAASRRAREAGVRRKQKLVAARALVRDLAVRRSDPEVESAAREALLDVAESFSPRVESGEAGLAYLDVDGKTQHFPGASPEVAMGRALMQAAESQGGLPIRVGFASSKLAARLAASQPSSPKVIDSEDEAQFLALFPLSRVAPGSGILATLARWGLRTLGDLAARPRKEVSSRFGNAGLELQALARGEDPRPLMPRQPPQAFREGMTLEQPLDSLEPFVFITRSALERLADRLKGQGLGCICLQANLELTHGEPLRRTIPLPTPTRDVKTLLTLLRLDLESHPPAESIAAFTLTAYADRPRAGQLSMFGPPAALPGKLAATMARLFEVVGEDRVGSPRAVDGAPTEAFALAPYTPSPASERDSVTPDPGVLAVRALRPPVEIEVLVGHEDEPVEEETTVIAVTDEPASSKAPPDFIKAKRDVIANRPRIQGQVRIASGPWSVRDICRSRPLSGRAPSEQRAAARDYWDVELAGSGVYRIFRDRSSGQWFADGVYD